MKNSRLILISAFVISLIGIVCSLYSFYFVAKGGSLFNIFPSSKFFQFLFFFKTLNLGFDREFNHIDIWNFVFYLLLFVGAIQYWKSKGKETRLVGFVFSVIFLSVIFAAVSSTVYNVLLFDKYQDGNSSIFKIIIGKIFLIGIAILSYKILITIKSEKELETTQSETKITIQETIKWQRFWHWIIDLTIMALIMIPIISTLIAIFLDTDLDLLRESSSFWINFFRSKASLYVIIFIVFFIYYPLTEILFGATPAKFLSESRVLDKKAEKPAAATIFGRTLCRQIPFDAFSFFAKRGWHDSLSETYVVKEKRTGFKTNRLLLILPFLALYLLLAYKGHDYYKNYLSSKKYKNEESLKLQRFKNDFNHINTGQIYSLSNLNFSNNTFVLGIKIEKIDGDNLQITKLRRQYSGDPYFELLKNIYTTQKDTSEVVNINKKELLKAIPKKMNESETAYIDQADLFGDGSLFQVSEVFDINSPYLENASVFSFNKSKNEMKISIMNIGGNGEIISLKNIENDINWITKIPISLSSSELEKSFFFGSRKCY